MPTRINSIPLQIEKAAGATRSPSFGLRLGCIASGVTHLAGGLVLGSVWGASLVQLVPPPYGTNAIQLTASQVVAIDATMDDVPEPAIPVAMLGVESSDEASRGLRPAQRPVRPDVGEMPPAPLVADLFEPADAVSATGLQATPPLLATTTTKQRVHKSRPAVEKMSRPALKKSAVVRPVTTDAAAAPATPSTRQQGQDAESTPQKVHSPAPAYPAEALRQGLTGRVVLRVQVDSAGVVVVASVLRSSGHAILDEAALAGVRQWRFQPAKQLGVAIEKEIAVPITFRIDR